MITIDLAVAEGTEPTTVNGHEILPGLIAHKDPWDERCHRRRPYRLTHAPSGRGFGRLIEFRSLEHARQAVAAVGADRVDWTAAEIDKADGLRIYHALRDWHPRRNA